MFMGLGQVFTGALRGAGSATAPMTITMISTLTRIPAAYFLAVQPNNPYGLFWSMAISVTLNFLLSAGYYKLGGWQKRSIVAAEANKKARKAEIIEKAN
jgi:Na+-driven multidrug efflux pump